MADDPQSPIPIPPHPISPARKMLVGSVAAVIVLANLYDGIRDSAHWPFHSFHMFSTLSDAHNAIVHRLVGVDAQGNLVSLSPDAYSEPIWIYHVRIRFDRAVRMRDEKRRCELLTKLSADYLSRYEQHRKSGTHSGPPLVGLRLYSYTWNKMDRWAQNVQTPDSQVVLYDSTQLCDQPQSTPANNSEPSTEERL